MIFQRAKTTVLFLLAVFCVSRTFARQAQDPFQPFLRSIPPVIGNLSSKSSGAGDQGIMTKEIVFASKNKINKVYALIAAPERAGKYPAILFLHGGSGNAAGLKDLLEKFAGKGYVAMACDMPGYCDIEHTPHSSGPWKAFPAPDEHPRFDVVGSPEQSSLVDAETAGLEAFNLLSIQANVDSSRMGITGFSWGGYSTTMLCGLLGRRVKAAYSYWGCGFYEKGSFWKELIGQLPADAREKWLTYFDAGRRAPYITADYFIEAATNDTYFWPEAVSATLAAIPGAKNHVWGPNVNHSLVGASAPMQEKYFDLHLKGIGQPFAQVDITHVTTAKDGIKNIGIALKDMDRNANPLVQLYYSLQGVKWQSRVWIPLKAEKQGSGLYQVLIPREIAIQPMSFYAHVTDANNVVTSGKMYDGAADTFNIKDFGAVGDGSTINTGAINAAISACAANGGGVVLVPDGNFLTGTLLMKSNVTLYLEQDAHIIGTSDLSQYRSFALMPENPRSPINITVRDSLVWCRALVLIDHVHDVTITGTGTIDGAGVIDKLGEEGRRGPHGILMGEAKNITISNIRVTRSGNYNILGLGVENIKISCVTITQGADGIHIRRGKDLLIENCKCYTADDAIAGGYWENMLIKDCLLNSSCNGVRLILPASRLEISHCEIFGPGVFGHSRGTKDHPLVTRSLTGIILQPGAWGLGAGPLEHVNIHDIRIRDMQTALTFVLNEGNTGRDIEVKNVVATGITHNACSVEAWPGGSGFEDVRFSNINISYNYSPEAASSHPEIIRPRTESQPLPYWGFYLRKVQHITMENVTLQHTGTEDREPIGFDSVGKRTFTNVHPLAVNDEWTNLLDKDLTNWNTYLSYKHQDGYNGKMPMDAHNQPMPPLGYNTDPESVFSLKMVDHQPVLRISGERYGCVFTKKEYRNYHLKLMVKFGHKKWPPRLNEPDDSGLLYHSQGPAGVDYWRSWMQAQEFQIMQGGFGDYWCVAATGAHVKMHDPAANNDMGVYDPAGQDTPMGVGGTRNGFVQHSRDFEKPGQWNTIELICFGDKSIHIINGHVVMALTQLVYKEDNELKPLTKGRLQLQSEAAEVFYKDIKIKHLTRVPAEYASFFAAQQPSPDHPTMDHSFGNNSSGNQPFQNNPSPNQSSPNHPSPQSLSPNHPSLQPPSSNPSSPKHPSEPRDYNTTLYQTTFPGPELPADFINPGNWKPSATSITSTMYGLKNYLMLNRQYGIDKRKVSVTAVLGADTKFDLFTRAMENTPIWGTLIQVDVAQGLLKIYSAFNADDTAYPSIHISHPYAFIPGRSYTFEMMREHFINKFIIIDHLTGASDTTEDTGDKTSGLMRDGFAIATESGVPPTITAFRVSTAYKPGMRLLFIGDSITEGMDAGGDSSVMISGRSGGRAAGVQNRVLSEIAMLKPKYVSILIGTNGFNTIENLTALCSDMLKMGVTPILNNIPWKFTGPVTADNRIIAAVRTKLKIKGAAFDNATSVDHKNIKQDLSLFKDGIHPNKAGADAMSRQLTKDVPELLRK